MSVNERGFTLVEFIAILVIAGVLAVGAVASFDRRGLDHAGAVDQIRAIVSHAQKNAVASRRAVRLTVRPDGASSDPNTVSLAVCSVAASTAALCPGSWSALAGPDGRVRLSLGAQVLLGGNMQTYTDGADTVSAIHFDALGRPANSAGLALVSAQTVTITGDSTVTVQVDPDTGYARRI